MIAVFIYLLTYLHKTDQEKKLTEEERESSEDSRRIDQATASARSRSTGGWLNRCRWEQNRQWAIRQYAAVSQCLSSLAAPDLLCPCSQTKLDNITGIVSILQNYPVYRGIVNNKNKKSQSNLGREEPHHCPSQREFHWLQWDASHLPPKLPLPFRWSSPI